MEREFIMIKPDGVQRGLIGEVIQRIERVGFKIIAMKMIQVSMEQAEEHYAIHKGKPFYEGLLEYITSEPVVAMVIEGKDAVKITRKIVGATDPVLADPGSIRGDFALDIGRNIIHAADSPENAIVEYKIYFDEEELLSYKRIDYDWLYE
ncbi:MAG: nucleoside-diphosphate kinase [Candidatus Heimdallarchaeota archaeon]|nr:nucleoside-diphosphate kinase [Candidatus Heimdallarchaeota archaeon]MCK4954243.1 nucleoside-diphosphate kinase [Candidatus Heimdallarchaeota archaeon]